jgi:hypothetical protein
MVVNTRVHEAMISRVRGEKWLKTGYSDTIATSLLLTPGLFTQLGGQKAFDIIREDFVETNRHLEMVKIADGQPAQVRVDAFPDRSFNADVKSVATVASQQDWMSADVKVYQTMVSIKDTVPGLKPGMSAEVTMFTDSARENCLTIPVQAILGTVDMGNKRRIYVSTPNGVEWREVTIGLSNDKMAEVESGLSEGDMVVVNPRVLLNEQEKAQFGETGAYRSSNGGGAAPKEGKWKDGKGKDGKGKDGKGKDGKGGWPGKGEGGPPKDGNGPA